MNPIRRGGHRALIVLQLAYAVAFLDRAMLGLLVEPIRLDLHLTDVQLSLLLGLAFAVLNATLGLPLGALADRWHRPRLLAACAAIWCLGTAACGLATGFATLFAARVIVGAGEAALGPIAPSLLSSYFVGRGRSVAMSVYQTASSVGAGLALIGGGAFFAVVQTFDLAAGIAPWRLVFFVIGIAGLIVPALVLILPEPRVAALRGETKASVEAFRQFFVTRRQLLACHFGGFALFSAMSYGVANWIPAFFEREHGWTTAQVGLRYGLIILASGTGGVLSGGVMASRLQRSGRTDAVPLVMALGAGSAGLFSAIAPIVSNASLSLTLYAVAIFFLSFPTGTSIAALHDVTPEPLRGRVTAIYAALVALIGASLGPYAVAQVATLWSGNGHGLPFSLSVNAAVLGTASTLLLWATRGPMRATIRHD